MKIRNGFVSNSSSSSFLIYGGGLEEEQVRNILEQHGKEVAEDRWENQEILESLLNELGYKIKVVYTPEGYEEIIVGRSWDTIGDDETGKQFKNSIEVELKQLADEEIKCSTCEEAWRDG